MRMAVRVLRLASQTGRSLRNRHVQELGIIVPFLLAATYIAILFYNVEVRLKHVHAASLYSLKSS